MRAIEVINLSTAEPKGAVYRLGAVQVVVVTGV